MDWGRNRPDQIVCNLDWQNSAALPSLAPMLAFSLLVFNSTHNTYMLICMAGVLSMVHLTETGLYESVMPSSTMGRKKTEHSPPSPVVSLICGVAGPIAQMGSIMTHDNMERKHRTDEQPPLHPMMADTDVRKKTHKHTHMQTCPGPSAHIHAQACADRITTHRHTITHTHKGADLVVPVCNNCCLLLQRDSYYTHNANHGWHGRQNRLTGSVYLNATDILLVCVCVCVLACVCVCVHTTLTCHTSKCNLPKYISIKGWLACRGQLSPHATN